MADSPQILDLGEINALRDFGGALGRFRHHQELCRLNDVPAGSPVMGLRKRKLAEAHQELTEAYEKARPILEGHCRKRTAKKKGEG
jgi:hypothetical protein